MSHRRAKRIRTLLRRADKLERKLYQYVKKMHARFLPGSPTLKEMHNAKI